jgi:hypothetical protein
MNLKSLLAKPFAQYIYKKIHQHKSTAVADQENIFKLLVKKAAKTKFGKQHNFSDISSYQDFIKNVPIRDYEQLKAYIEEIKKGEPNVMWPGTPIYFAKTSGTTSGVKYIPITKDSIGIPN